MVDNRKIAAVAAALAYIETESSVAAVRAAAQRGIPEQAATGGRSVPNPWALYGRQRIMNMRALMQRRAISRRV